MSGNKNTQGAQPFWTTKSSQQHPPISTLQKLLLKRHTKIAQMKFKPFY